MSSYSARDAHRRGSIVPPLAGVDRPALEVVPESCDVIICGTGLTESILAAALAWQGTNVLHIDANPHYGDAWASLSVPELQQYLDGEHSLKGAQLYAPRDPRKVLIDLNPHVMFAKSDMLDLLLKSRVFKYLEFKALGQFHTFEQDSFEKVSGNKQDIFTDQTLSAQTKRRLMKFIKWVVEWQVNPEELRNQTAHQFLSSGFQLEDPQINELVVAIGLCESVNVPALVALQRVRRYLLSLDIYGYFPVLYSTYGSGGELAQAFCRSAAVAGATYKLDTRLESFDPKSQIATLSDGSKIQVAEKVVMSPTQPSPFEPEVEAEAPEYTTRLTAVVSNECKEWYANKESAAIVVFPPGSLKSNTSAVHTVVFGPGAGSVPAGTSAWYLSTHEQDERKARQDLAEALEQLDATILRESGEGIDLGNLSAEDVQFKPDGTPVVSSVRLGQSMHSFVPKQKLQYLAKLAYRQESVSKPQPAKAVSEHVLLAPPALAEMSYDGVIASAKLIYEQIVGSDDDFFDIDFEDDDEQSKDVVAGLDEEVMHMEI